MRPDKIGPDDLGKVIKQLDDVIAVEHAKGFVCAAMDTSVQVHRQMSKWFIDISEHATGLEAHRSPYTMRPWRLGRYTFERMIWNPARTMVCLNDSLNM